MDGVLTDFDGACELIEMNMMTWYRCDKDRFWKRVTEAGVCFWSDMPWLQGGRELYAHLTASNLPLSILSALPFPERGEALANARAGKIKWLRRELGEAYAKDAILCQRTEKALHSGPTRVLIDDNFKNISEWEDAGGIGVLHKNTDRTIRNLSRIIETEHEF